ncbi:MAG: hypothetical protein V1723_04120 [Candidatus Uhrbacteria bacterium]
MLEDFVGVIVSVLFAAGTLIGMVMSLGRSNKTGVWLFGALLVVGLFYSFVFFHKIWKRMRRGRGQD